MGIGDWQDEEVDFDWRRIEDNLIKLRPETLKKINDLIVRAGHELEPKAIEAVRGDTFVVETNIHYPTESSLIGDGLRKVVTLGGGVGGGTGAGGLASARAFAAEGHASWCVRSAGRRVPRARGRSACKPGYQELLELAEELLQRARQLLQALAFAVDPKGVLDAVNAAAPDAGRSCCALREVDEKVCGKARRRVLARRDGAQRGEDFQHLRAAHGVDQAWQAAEADPVWSQRAGDRGCGGFCG